MAYRMRMSFRLVSLAAVCAALVLSGCSGTGEVPPGLQRPEHGHTSQATLTPKPVPTTPARKGESFTTVTMPAAYAPKAPTKSGTDEYRCFLIDPGFTQDMHVSGVDIQPGNPALVHHVIVFQAAPSQLAQAKKLDAAEPGDGWTCFGGSGLDRSRGGNLDDAGWVGAWAPGGGERVLPADIAIPLAKGTQLVVQMHYNLLGGTGTDQSAVRLRVTPAATSTKEPLRTLLLPAPVELPCRPDKPGQLCNRLMAIANIKARFQEEITTADLLHAMCGPIKPGPVQSCTRTIREATTLRAVAGHMHLLGRAITIDVNKGTEKAKRVLDITNWDFDNQATKALPKPVKLVPGDTLTVTCTHDQSLRDRLPAFKGQPERYVAWGEGTTDEMCLGIVLATGA